MRAQISAERLHEIRRELGDDKFQATVSSRNRIRIDLVKAKRRLAHAEQQMAYHKNLNNPHGVATWVGEKLFSETLIATLERRLAECR